MSALAPATDREVTFSDNMPPDQFAALKIHADDLLDQARSITVVSNEDQRQALDKLDEDLTKAAKLLEDLRVERKTPHDDAITEIQNTFNPYLAPLTNKTVKGKIPLARDALKKAKEPYLQKLEDDRLAAVKKAQDDAAEAARVALEASRAAAPEDIEAREDAEVLIVQAQTLQRTATRAVASVSRGSGLKSIWTPEITDANAALLHYAKRRPDDLMAVLLDLAREEIRAGLRTIPGFTITEKRVAA